MTNQIIKQAQEKLERLDMEDQDSKGCTITLAEWMSKDNMELLNDFISQAITQAVEEKERENKHLKEVVKIYEDAVSHVANTEIPE